jgi:hypothetical protein
MTEDKIQVGIIANTQNMPAWAFYVIQQLRHSKDANIALFIKEDAPDKQSLTKKVIHAYLRAEGRSSQKYNWEEIKLLLDGIPFASPSDPNLLSHKLDLILNLGNQPAPSHLAQTARFGLWEVSDGERIMHADDVPGFFELLHRKPITNCAIFADNGESRQLILQGPLATDPILVSRNRDNFFWKAAFLLLKAIRTLHYKGETVPETAPGIRLENHNGSGPNVLDLMRMGISQVSRFVFKNVRKRFYRDQWILMLAKNTQGIETNWGAFQPLYPSMNRFWADPFVLVREGFYYVFFEELPYITNLGRIACMILDADGKILDNRPILEKPYHLSYPFIFEYDDNLYMIPETGANKTIDVYRCTSFPFEWEYHKTLMDGIEAKDATLLERNGKWWLFATIREHEQGSTWDQLSVFWADDPLSENWSPHPLNPVVVDVRSARPAGQIFSQDGNLIRPSQDCSVRYGYALNFNRITKLSETEYEEVCETRLEPPKNSNILATHTYNQTGGLTIIDATLHRKK